MNSAAQWTSPPLERIAAFIQEYAGLVFPLNRQASAESGIRRAMARLGITDPRVYLNILIRGGLPLDDLLAELTIGETYFFRESAQFTFLRNDVIPWFTKNRTKSQGIRAWSAACASGEEAYSLAILLGELRPGAPDTVLGTDISRARLSSAQRARYRKWSLRALPQADIDRLFRVRGDVFELAPAFRRITDFRYLNLAEDNYPAISTAVWGMDIIFCRNVLIYFDRETIRRVGRRLIDSLSTDGWLFLGASDPVLSDYVRCDVVQTANGLVYRKNAGTHPSIADIARYGISKPNQSIISLPHFESRDEIELAVDDNSVRKNEPDDADEDYDVAKMYRRRSDDELRDKLDKPNRNVNPESREKAESEVESPLDAAIRMRDFDRVVAVAQAMQSAGDRSEYVAVAYVRGLANLGRTSEADKVCMAALEDHRMSSELVYLHAILLIQAGRHKDAVMAARRALYLDRSFIVAHLAMANASSRIGDVDIAIRALRNAEELLEALPSESIVPSSDGETASRLLAMTRVQRTLLKRDVS